MTTVSEWTAFVLNNVILVAAGGLLAMLLAWRMWKKVDGWARSINDWGGLFFWAVKHVAIVVVIVFVGSLIYTKVNQAVIAAVNSPSVQTAGGALVQLGAGFDQLAGWDGSTGGGNLLVASDIANAISLFEPVNGGATASFTGQAVTLESNREETVVTAEQAVAAFNALAATATPVGGGMTYINTFLADNMPTIDVVADVTGSYTIKRGDSLAKIAKAVYGDSNKWVLICKANNIPDCNNVRAGMVLTIPGGNSTAPANVVAVQPTPIPAWQPPQQQQVYAPAPVQAVRQAAPVANPYTGQVAINNNADAIAAIQAIAPTPAPVVAQVAPTPTNTPRAVNTYAELKSQQVQSGMSGAEYIAKFMQQQTTTTVADAGSSNP